MKGTLSMASSKAKGLTINTTISSIQGISKITCLMVKDKRSILMVTVMLEDGRMACFMGKGRIRSRQKTRIKKERELRSIQGGIMKA